MAKKKKYSFSFTGASALLSETMVIAEEYVRLNNWNKVRESVQEDNLINKTKKSTAIRKFNEIKKRLELLTTEQLNLLINGSPDEAKAMLLLSLIKAYAFFKDFVVEVIRLKYLLYNNVLKESDYTSFFNAKAITNNELNEITEKTANKAKQVLFRMLEQIGLISTAKDGIITKPFLSDDAIKAILNDDGSQLAGFLCSDAEIRTFKKAFVHV
jgi:hypothetical protein